MSFEKEYYEAPDFWAGSMLADEDNNTRIKTTVDLIPSDCNSVLDVGCGNGKFLHKIKETNTTIKVIGTDRSDEALQYVNAEKFVSNITEIPKENEFADCVTCLQVLEHIHDATYAASLKELARVAKKYIIVSVPYNEDLKKSFTECPKCKSEFSWELHMRSYTNHDMEHMFDAEGFSLVKSLNIVQREELMGQQFFNKIRQILKPSAPKQFRSPICIVCGFKPENQIGTTIASTNQTSINSGSATGIKSAIKRLWPKQKVDGYWVIALYKRN